MYLYTSVACIHLCGLLQASSDVGMTKEQRKDEKNQFLSSPASQGLRLFYFQGTGLHQLASEEGSSDSPFPLYSYISATMSDNSVSTAPIFPPLSSESAQFPCWCQL